MLSAATTHLTPADLETRLADLGIPVDRLIAAARIARSTWSAWRAGRTRPRPDRWSAATAAFDALVAESTPAPADDAVATAAAEPITLTGSSAPTGAPPSFVPIATAAPAGEPAPAAVDAIRRDLDDLVADVVVVEADRVAHLARREWAALAVVMATDQRRPANPNNRAEIACRAALRLNGRANRRLRSGARALARQPAATPAAVAAKARAVLAIRNATDEDAWFAVLRDSVVRDAAQLGRAPSETTAAAVTGADEVAALRAEWASAAAWDTRMAVATNDLVPADFPASLREESRHRYAVLASVLQRLVEQRCSTLEGLTLKAAAVVSACGRSGIDPFISDDHVDEVPGNEVALALSLVRDVFDMIGAPAQRLVHAALYPAELPAVGAVEAPIAAAAA